MNLRNLTLAYKVGSYFFGRYRDLNAEQKRNVYEAVRVLAHPESTGTEDETRFSAARREAGPLTRAAHDRLDRQRALFDASQLNKQALKQAAKDEKKNKSGKNGAIVSVSVLGLLAAAAGAVWYFFFRDDTPVKPAAKPASKSASSGVRVTEQTGKNADKIATGKPITDETNAGGAHGPLSEEPAERDEALLSSIDEQLSTLDSTLDALDDDQRNITEPRGN